MNSIHPNIKLTMETEKDGSLPFLDLLIHRKPNGTLGHGVYRKATHTEFYLNSSSCHNPAQKRSVISTLFHRALTITDSDHRTSEINHLFETLQANGFNKRTISAIHHKVKKKTIPRDRQSEDNDGQTTRAFIPFCGNLSNKIGRILGKHGIKTVHLLPSKIRNRLRSAKDDLGLQTVGVYKIPCDCGKVYIGQTGRTVQERLIEHQRHLRYLYTDKSARAEHSTNEGHKILFEDTTLLHKGGSYGDRIVKEAIEIHINLDNINRDTGCPLSSTWGPIIRRLKLPLPPYTNTNQSQTTAPSCPHL